MSGVPWLRGSPVAKANQNPVQSEKVEQGAEVKPEQEPKSDQPEGGVNFTLQENETGTELVEKKQSTQKLRRTRQNKSEQKS